MAIINGTGSNDALRDGSGDDTISAMGGDDRVIVSAGRDTVDGGDGFDTLAVDYGDADFSVRNNGEARIGDVSGIGPTSVQFARIEQFRIATGGSDDIIRTFVRPDFGTSEIVSGNDFVDAGAGNDQAAGGDGNDELRGREGNDLLDGDGSLRGKFGGTLGDMVFSGDDFLIGDEGNDTLLGGAGSDILDGGIGDDALYGDGSAFRAIDGSAIGGPGVQIQMAVGNDLTSGNDLLDGGDGNDLLVGNAGDDQILGGSGNDTAEVTVTSDGADQVDLGEGSDVVLVSANANADVSSAIRVSFTSSQVGNGNANDSNTMANQDGGLAVRLQSEDYVDGLIGPVGRYDDEGITFVAVSPAVRFDVRDLVSGVARGNQFEVVVLGNAGADTLTAVQADRAYYFNAGMGDDTVAGGNGNDFLVGGAGNDTLTDAIGNDSVLGGGGNDTIATGMGTDTAFFNVSTDGADAVNLGDGSDVVSVSAAAAGQIRVSFTSAQVGNGNAFDSNNMMNQDGGLAVRFQAENGSDGLTGPVSRFDDEGITFVAATPGVTFDVRDLVSGVARGDLFEVVVLGTIGADTLTAVQADRPYYFNAGMGDDSVFGGTANDFLVGGTGNDLLAGGAGDDAFLGGDGDDLLRGANGADTLNGGGGADRLVGGNDADLFVLSPATFATRDTVVDFTDEDFIGVSAAAFGNGLVAGEDVTAGNRFAANAAGKATEAFAQFVYDTGSGRLAFDADGTGAGAAMVIASFRDAPLLVASDFIVLA